MTTEQDYLWNRRHAVLYRVELSILYHKKHAHFFDVFSSLCDAVAWIGIVIILANLSNSSVVAGWAAATAIAMFIKSAFRLQPLANWHTAKAREYAEIQADIAITNERGFTEQHIGDWTHHVSLIEASERATLGNLVILCQNELAISQGQFDKVVPLRWWQRLFAHFG